jgi:hypothetical protein
VRRRTSPARRVQEFGRETRRIGRQVPSLDQTRTPPDGEEWRPVGWFRRSGAAGRANGRGDPGSDRQDRRRLSWRNQSRRSRRWSRRRWNRRRCSRSSPRPGGPLPGRRPREPQDHLRSGRPARRSRAARPPSRVALSVARSAGRTGRSSAVRRRSRAGRGRRSTARRRR